MTILTLILVILTGIYVFLTHRILRANQLVVAAMRDQINASIRPYIYFDLVPRSVFIEARLRNSGMTAAHDVQVKTEQVLRVLVRSTARPAKLTNNTITLLAPGREIVEFIGSWQEVRSMSCDLVITGAISYSDSGGRRYEEPFRIDLGAHEGMVHVGWPDPAEQLKLIVEQLEGINSQLRERGS